MRYLPILFATLVITACSTAPIETPTARPTQVTTSEQPKASTDSVVQFLVTSAATDFHTHVRSDSIRFRNVRLGHIMTSSGEEQYMLCGEYQEAGKDEWVPFATIKTSGYEQWNGVQAEAFCQRSAVIWDKGSDLSSSLQSRLDSMR